MHGHRARALQRKAAKELKKTSKWAARELHSLETQHRRFMRDARDAAQLERSIPPSLCACSLSLGILHHIATFVLCMLFVSEDPASYCHLRSVHALCLWGSCIILPPSFCACSLFLGILHQTATFILCALFVSGDPASDCHLRSVYALCFWESLSGAVMPVQGARLKRAAPAFATHPKP